MVEEEPTRAIGAEPAAVAAVSWPVLVARYLASVYVFLLVFLVLAAVLPALVAGWQPLSVVTGSMQPAVAPGSLVLVQPATSDHHYGHPSILAFADPSRPGQLLTHRVVATAATDDGVVYTTKGDANLVADSDLVPHDQVVGAVRMVVPFVGLPATWWHGGEFALLAAWVGGSLLAVSVLLVRFRS